jgi:hypothetical protein
MKMKLKIRKEKYTGYGKSRGEHNREKFERGLENALRL